MGRWAGEQVDWWAGGQVGRWTGGQEDIAEDRGSLHLDDRWSALHMCVTIQIAVIPVVRLLLNALLLQKLAQDTARRGQGRRWRRRLHHKSMAHLGK